MVTSFGGSSSTGADDMVIEPSRGFKLFVGGLRSFRRSNKNALVDRRLPPWMHALIVVGGTTGGRITSEECRCRVTSWLHPKRVAYSTAFCPSDDEEKTRIYRFFWLDRVWARGGAETSWWRNHDNDGMWRGMWFLPRGLKFQSFGKRGLSEHGPMGEKIAFLLHI